MDAQSPSTSPRDKLILVVDDNENIRVLLEICLKTEGFQVLTAVNGLDARAKLEQRVPDLIVTDLMMPGQDGYDFLRMLPSAGLASSLIFIISGSGINPSTIDMIRRESGALEFFPKPIKMTAFVAAVHKHLKTTPSTTQTRGLNDRP